MAMEIKVHGKHNHVPPALERFAAQKVGRLSKFLPGITHIEVELYEEGKIKDHNHIAEVTILAGGPTFRTKATSSDHRACIDIAYDRLRRQLTSFHRKRLHKPAHARPAKEVLAAVAAESQPSPAEEEMLPPPDYPT